MFLNYNSLIKFFLTIFILSLSAYFFFTGYNFLETYKLNIPNIINKLDKENFDIKTNKKESILSSKDSYIIEPNEKEKSSPRGTTVLRALLEISLGSIGVQDAFWRRPERHLERSRLRFVSYFGIQNIFQNPRKKGHPPKAGKMPPKMPQKMPQKMPRKMPQKMP